jgi:hypothetical protein
MGTLPDSDFNERTGLFNELHQLLPGLSEWQFQQLMHHTRDETRYICHWCASDANLGNSEPYGHDVPTAYGIDHSKVRCIVCDRDYSIEEGTCFNDECDSTLLSADPDSLGRCMVCGWDKKDWEDHQVYQKRTQSEPYTLLFPKPIPTADNP